MENAVVGGADAERFARLARAMPGACMAVVRVGDPAPRVHAAKVLRARLAAFTDHLVRTAPLSSNLTALPPPKPRQAAKRMPVAMQWVAALRSDDPLVGVDGDDADRLARELSQWSRSIESFSAAPFRLCFRLEEPQIDPQDEDDAVKASTAMWRVEFILQAADDPSLQVTATDVWSAKKSAMAVVQRPGFRAREFLLMALGHAARLWPVVDASLNAPDPVMAEVETGEAVRFLTDYAPALEQAGFAVMLPTWWTRRGSRLRLTSRAKVKGPKLNSEGKLSLASVIEFDFEVALGEETLTRKQLEELARQKSTLVRVRGQWVQVDQAELKTAIDEYLKKKASQALTMADVMKMALSGDENLGGLPFEGVDADGPVGDFLAQLTGEAAFVEQAPPAGLNTTLRPYQQRGYSWMTFLGQWGLGACLADDMGLGKTVQVITLMKRRWDEMAEKLPTLVVCPTSVIGNWQREAARFVPDVPVMVHHGTSRQKGDEFAALTGAHGIVLTSYSLLQPRHRYTESGALGRDRA